MEIKTRQHHFKKHRTELNATSIHEILANGLAKEVGLDLGDSSVSYSVRVFVSSLDRLPRAIVEVTECIIDTENCESAKNE